MSNNLYTSYFSRIELTYDQTELTPPKKKSSPSRIEHTLNEAHPWLNPHMIELMIDRTEREFNSFVRFNSCIGFKLHMIEPTEDYESHAVINLCMIITKLYHKAFI